MKSKLIFEKKEQNKEQNFFELFFSQLQMKLSKVTYRKKCTKKELNTKIYKICQNLS